MNENTYKTFVLAQVSHARSKSAPATHQKGSESDTDGRRHLLNIGHLVLALISTLSILPALQGMMSLGLITLAPRVKAKMR